MNITRNAHFHEIRNIDLADVIQVPSTFRQGIVKCRVTYGRQIERVEFQSYKFSNPRSFKLVNADHINYQYKSANREALRALFANRGVADDIIMVKDGLITDAYYANLLFLRQGRWYTPQKPMLEGTFRRKLIMNEKIVEVNLRPEDLNQYEEVKIINALTEWEMHKAVACDQIIH